ncbi:MAG: septum formation protein Maf [Ruminococcaceae bacterium]|nr:septum formation protein Maf [Oscillospiraceae bacterium]
MIVLASKSPRRQQLMKEAGIDYVLKVRDTDESHDESMGAEELVKMLAERKADAVRPLCSEEDIIISADTVVACEGRILGKPDGYEGALSMLAFLSGREQSVFTGVCIWGAGKKVVFADESVIVFRELSEEEIRRYVEDEEPYDKAGAYAVQEGGGHFVREMRGDYNNVVGLPVDRVKKTLQEEFGYKG